MADTGHADAHRCGISEEHCDVEVLKKVNQDAAGVLSQIHEEIMKLSEEIRSQADTATSEVENIAAVSEEITASARSISKSNEDTMTHIKKKKTDIRA